MSDEFPTIDTDAVINGAESRERIREHLKNKSGGMGGHQATVGRTETWLTPKYITDALGPFDMDPCAAPEPRPWPTAARHVTLPEDGLFVPWEGRVWLNPPYGNKTWHWIEKLVRHGEGTALVFARTETAGFMRHVWGRASAILFLAGRVRFCEPDGTPGKYTGGAPSALVAYGQEDMERLSMSGLDGAFVTGWDPVGERILGQL